MENGISALYISRNGVEKRLAGLTRAGVLSPRRELIDVTPLDADERSFANGKADCGILSAEFRLPGADLLEEIAGGLFAGEALGVRLVLANGCSFAFSARVVSFSAGAGSVDGAPALAVEFRISGGIEITNAEE